MGEPQVASKKDRRFHKIVTKGLKCLILTRVAWGSPQGAVWLFLAPFLPHKTR